MNQYLLHNIPQNFYQSSRNRLVNISKLIYHYYSLVPDSEIDEQKVKFGTSGHRGTSTDCTFNEQHVLAITQSIVQMRKKYNIDGPCFIGKDTHILSELAFISVLEVLSANRVDVIIETIDGYTPTPIVTHAILNYNRKCYDKNFRSDGIVVTSSHNPPEDGGLKYYSFYGGIADTDITEDIEKYSNMLLLNNLREVRRLTLSQAHRSGYIHFLDFTQNYITELTKVVNMRSIKQSGLRLCVDLMGGSGINCWYRVAQFYKLDLVFRNEIIDPTFQFMQSDLDGILRMDCTSKNTMRDMLKIRDQFDLIFSNDLDCDRYSIITPSGFVESNDYIVIAIDYLFQNRPNWSKKLGIGKTLVSSSMIDKIVKKCNLRLLEAPIGFKWFVKGLFHSMLGFAGEESAGGIFLDFNSVPWSSDKDGIIMCLLAAEISAITERQLQELYNKLFQNINLPSYNRFEIPTKYYSNHNNFFNVFIEQISIKELAGSPVIKKIKIASDKKGTKIDGVKLITKNGWIAFRRSGTENIYKFYSESFLGCSHRKVIEYEVYDQLFHMIE